MLPVGVILCNSYDLLMAFKKMFYIFIFSY